MRRLELKAYNGQWENKGLRARLRRKILNATRQGECLLIDVEGVEGLTAAELGALLARISRIKLRVTGLASLKPKRSPPKAGLVDRAREEPS
jgi:hypothetical protein